MNGNRHGRSVTSLLKGDRHELDLVDALVAPAALISIAVFVGIGTFSLYGFDASAGAITAAGTTFSWAFVIGLVAFATAGLTNMPHASDWSPVNWGVVAGGIGAMIVLQLVPDIQSAVTANDTIALIVAVLMSAAYYVLAYY
jgi:hypothetical protein